MEQEPQHRGDAEAEQPSGSDASGEMAEQELDIEFGQLSPASVQGSLWDELVITRGIAAAERAEGPIDQRTAHYIARWLTTASTPALRTLASTGAVHQTSLEEELVSVVFDQRAQVRDWTGWLADYYRNRQDHGPVPNWREDIARQDQADLEAIRRERVCASLDELYQAVQPYQRIPNAGQPGWYGLVRHEQYPGGVIIFEGSGGERSAWETDSDAELVERYTTIVEAQRQWVFDTLGEPARPDFPGASDEDADDPDGDAEHRRGGQDHPER